MADRVCWHGQTKRHPDGEWYTWCPGGSLLWNAWHWFTMTTRIPYKTGTVIYRYPDDEELRW